jgi:hypothetical protein
MKTTAIAAPGPWTCQQPGCQFSAQITDVGRVATWWVDGVALCDIHAQAVAQSVGCALPARNAAYAPLVNDVLRIWRKHSDGEGE